MMTNEEIAERVVDLCDYYLEELEEAKTPMDIMGLNWYVQECVINLFKDIYLDRKAH